MIKRIKWHEQKMSIMLFKNTFRLIYKTIIRWLKVMLIFYPGNMTDVYKIDFCIPDFGVREIMIEKRIIEISWQNVYASE